MSYTIHYESNPKPEDIQILNDGIMEHAKHKKGMKPFEFFAFFIRDNEGEIIGGCSGDILYGSLYVGSLWVSEKLRGQGYGTKLMQSTENLAKAKDSHFIILNTMDWEALDFYKKLGFYVEFERDGYERNSTIYFLRKDMKNLTVVTT